MGSRRVPMLLALFEQEGLSRWALLLGGGAPALLLLALPLLSMLCCRAEAALLKREAACNDALTA